MFPSEVKLWAMPPTREGWLNTRRMGLGGSDAAAACGLSNWQTRLGLYLDKTGQAEDQDQTERMYWGTRLEAIVAEEYTIRTGRAALPVNNIIQSVAYPFMLANLDRFLPSEDRGPGILECKTVDRYMAKEWGESGTDQVPKEYLLQVQHYMAVTGCEWGELAVLVGGNEFRIYPVLRDAGLIESLVELEAELWGMVQRQEPPEPDCDHKTTEALLRKLYPGTNGSVVDLADLAADHEHLREAKAQLKELEAVELFHKNRILAALGEASAGIMPDGSGYVRNWRKPSVRAACEVAGGFSLNFKPELKLPGK